jgi:signal transduction histidine kinase
VAITVAPLATLVWLGWRLLQQDRILEQQRAQEQMELAADLVVASLQRALASSEQRLAAGARDWPEGAAVLTVRDNRVEAWPKERLAYLPTIPELPEAPSALFAEGEELEFRKKDYDAAIPIFRKLAGSPNAAVRAGALLRLGRNLANTGRIDEALAAYHQLAMLDNVAVSGAPAGLVGRYARCDLLERTKRTSDFRTEVQQFEKELTSGRWALAAPLYGLYVRDLARWNGTSLTATADPELFAEAAVWVWQRRQSLPSAGRQTITVEGRDFVVLWQHSAESLRALIAAPSFAQMHWLAAAEAVSRQQKVDLRIGDAGLGDEAGRSAKRTAKQTDLPWDVFVSGRGAAAEAGEFASRRRLLVAGFAALAVMALAASYLVVRAINRELAVARLQSDFVAAVSHEFRTPLTALRQFTDMLRENERFASDQGKQRRLVCYDAQSRATERLTKLVESLLDFGRMEAGARRYDFERRDCAELACGVVEDFRNSPQATGCDLRFSGNGAAPIRADGEALSRAIWNLLDNAAKYSPDDRTVEVDVHRTADDVRIDVRDHGLGIPAHEREAIFAKFQRGQQARTRGIQGTGIGLAIVNEIVKAHRGRVEVKSEAGKGSVFTIVLPVSE